MRIMIVTDAWKPQVNGVVRTLDTTKRELMKKGHRVEMVTPLGCTTISMPTYSEIDLVLSPKKYVVEKLNQFNPEMIHIATEGPLGWSARKLCKKNNLKFTTSFHTQFPEYIHARTRLPTGFSYKILKRFHSLARQVMVTTKSMERKLKHIGFQNLTSWSRGVDTELFRPMSMSKNSNKPILLYVGRIAVEKNLEAFLSMDIDAVKYVVGDGPQLPQLKLKYPNVIFTGAKFGQDLVQYYAMADAFVFPSRTDTFGLVMLEALACGTPVAAYPVEGPIDVIQSDEIGCLDLDLKKATLNALKKSRKLCREFALMQSWARCTTQFYNNLNLA